MVISPRKKGSDMNKTSEEESEPHGLRMSQAQARGKKGVPTSSLQESENSQSSIDEHQFQREAACHGGEPRRFC